MRNAPWEKPVVWVVQRPRRRRDTGLLPDLTPAEGFGPLRYLFDAQVTPSLGVAFKPCLDKLCSTLEENFNPRIDYLLWATGDPVALMVIGVALAHCGYDSVNWLRYERITDAVRGRQIGHKYVPEVMDVSEPRH